MTSQPNPAPGFDTHPGHTITIEPLGQSVTVSLGQTVIASSQDAKLLKEGTYPPVVYIPLADMQMEHFTKSDTSTYCPFKGDASYWGIRAGDAEASDAMWGYEAPFDEMAGIADHGAFYPDKVIISIG